MCYFRPLRAASTWRMLARDSLVSDELRWSRDDGSEMTSTKKIHVSYSFVVLRQIRSSPSPVTVSHSENMSTMPGSSTTRSP